VSIRSYRAFWSDVSSTCSMIVGRDETIEIGLGLIARIALEQPAKIGKFLVEPRNTQVESERRSSRQSAHDRSELRTMTFVLALRVSICGGSRAPWPTRPRKIRCSVFRFIRTKRWG